MILAALGRQLPASALLLVRPAVRGTAIWSMSPW